MGRVVRSPAAGKHAWHPTTKRRGSFLTIKSRAQELSWWYWSVTGILVTGALIRCPLGFTPAIGLIVDLPF
jgi:hypothetical protein